MAKKRANQHIDEDVAKRVRDLHKKHPQLGHDGIGRLLEDEGIYVDEHALRVFMEEHRLAAGPTSFRMGDTNPLRHIPHWGGAIKIEEE